MMMAVFAIAAAGIATTAIVVVSSTSRMHLRWNLAQRNLAKYEAAITAFRRDVGVYPSNFSELNFRPSLTDDALCRTRFTQQQLDGWGSGTGRTAYLQQIVPSSGAIIGVGLATQPFDVDRGGQPNNLIIHVTNVRPGDAERLDAVYDNSDGRLVGRVRWSTLSSQERFLTLDYYIPVTGC